MSKMNTYIIIFLALLIACMGISTAADVDNSTDGAAVLEDAQTASIDVQATSTSDNNIIKNNKNIKNENEYDGITINQSNYNTYFDSNGNTTSQLDGITNIRFSGELNIDQSLTIDRALNITSTEDGIIKLNTVAGSLLGTNPGNSFTINNGGSNSNITGLKFYNTQVFVKNAENVVLDGINVTVEDQTIGSGVGVTSIRDGSSHVTVKNSYFYTKNNGGSSTLVLAGASYSTLDNNTIVGSGNVGNLLYLTTYNVNGVLEDDIELNSYNNITNNTITRPDGESDITYGITLTGHDNLIANNIVNIYGQGITTQWGYTDPATPQIGDNSERYKGNFYINNTVNNAASFRATNNSTVENNTLTGTVITGANSTFVNNTISAKVTAQTGSSLYNNTIFDGVLINTKNVRLIGNNISKTVNMTKNDVYLEYNHICGKIKIKAGLSNITVINNILCAGFYETSQPTTVSNNTHCGSDCTANTCMCSHTILNSNKNLKQDDNDTILITADNVDDYFEIYNADGDLVSDSGGKPYEVCPISSVERANRGKTYLIDSSAIAKMGHGSSYLSSGYVNIVGVGKPTIRVNSMGIMSHFSNFTIKLIADPEDEEYLPNLRFSVGQDLTEDITYENLSIIYDLETTTTSIVNLTKFGKVYGYNSSDFEIRNTLTLRNSEIKCSFPTENINWGSVNRPYIVPVVIPKGVSNVTIENCNITLEELSYGKNYSTLWGIYNLQNNTKIINNNISISGQKYLYAIENAVSNTNISNNNIVVNGTHYTAGVYITGTNMQNNTVENNNITLYSGYGHAGDNGLEEDSGYAVVIEDRSYG